MYHKYFEINRKLVPIKAHYFFWQASLSTVQPNLTSYARQLGFSSVVVGLLFTMMPIFSIIMRPLFGMAADKFHIQKEIFIGSEMLVLFSSLVILHIPMLRFKNHEVDLICTTDQSAILQISAEHLGNCTLIGYKNKRDFDNLKISYESNTTNGNLSISVLTQDILYKNNELMFPIEEIKEGNQTISWCQRKNESFRFEFDNEYEIDTLFPYPGMSYEQIQKNCWCWILFAAMAFYWAGIGVVNSLGDTVCFQLLGDNPNDYGRQRLFGALGWGIFSLITGYISDILTDGKAIVNYSFCFYTSIILIAIDVIICLKIKVEHQNETRVFNRNIGQFFLNIKNDVFFMWCIFLGICSALIWQFLYWLIQDLLVQQDCLYQYYEKSLEGLVQFIETIFGEIPLFFISGWFLKKVGHINTMSLVMLCLGVRLALYSVISNPWWFLPVELMNGVDFGLCFSCMASYASFIAPEGSEATMQSLMGAMYEGIGYATGSALGGVFYKDYGGINTFRYFAYFAIISSIIHVVVQYFINRKSKK